jgi:Xaa-Pro aminopeptidase
MESSQAPPVFADERKLTYLNVVAADSPLASPVSNETIAAARRYRKERMIEQIVLNDCDALLLYDPINIRYVLDVSNMTIWMMHNAFHYALICADGSAYDFAYGGSEHLSAGLEGITNSRSAIVWTFQDAMGREASDELVARWAAELDDLIKAHGSGQRRIAVDTCEPTGLRALERRGLTVIDGYPLTETARQIKSADELEMLRWTMKVCDAGIQRLYDRSDEPGRSELEIWAELHHENIRNGGEWIETRLLASGPRTNPWFQEASHRRTELGDMLSFDTDMIGPYGYCADISRAWTVGHVPPTPIQRDLYLHALEQIEHNAELLIPGIGFREINARSWRIPERFVAQNYGCILHGVGLADESPWLATHPSFEGSPCDREDLVLLPGMVLSVESYIGEVGGHEGVKLEAQFVVTETGYERLDHFPWEDWA